MRGAETRGTVPDLVSVCRTSRIHHSVLNRLEFCSCDGLGSDRGRSFHPLQKSKALPAGRSAICLVLADHAGESRQGVQSEHQCVSLTDVWAEHELVNSNPNDSKAPQQPLPAVPFPFCGVVAPVGQENP